jgi:NADH-quinone oxidoreductase subunit C
METPLQTLQAKVIDVLGGHVLSLVLDKGELTLTVAADAYLQSCQLLRSNVSLAFEQLVDLCGVDCSTYKNEVREHSRYWVVLHLLSVSNNWRLRVKVCCSDDDFPVVASVVDVWSAASWYEREAFDMYGILFDGHPDLRRILTDYGFVGHPFRKDFPLSGHVEMRYDPALGRVVYQPLTIEPREVIPRVVREPSYGGVR